MDLSSLSDQDFTALQSGDLKGMSDAGFAALMKAQAAATPQSVKVDRVRQEMAQTYSPTAGMGAPELMAAGAGKAVSNMGTALRQALPGSGVDRAAVDEMKARDAPLMATGAGKVGYGLGAAATAVPAMMAPGANTVVGGALYGAGLGALTPVGADESVLTNAAIGAIGGGGSAAALKASAKVLAPSVTPGAQNLTRDGVRLTPGQQLGGAFKRAEDALTSMPVTGDFIRDAQRRSFQDFNAAVANRALAPINARLPAGLAGRDAVDYVERSIGAAYDSVLNRAGSIQVDQPFAVEIANLRNSVRNSSMPRDVQQQFEKVMSSQINGKFQGQSVMTAETFKQAEGELGRLAARYGSDASVDKQLLGDALQEAQASLRRLLERSSGSANADEVKAANAGWAEFKRMQRAASMLGAKDGVFSPENYLNAVKALDRSKDKGAFARGSAFGQDMGADAVRVMGSTVPDSGTPFRTLMAEPLKGAVSVAAGSPLAALYSSPAALRVAQVVLSGKRPALATKLAAELQAMSPALTAAGITSANVYQQSRPR